MKGPSKQADIAEIPSPTKYKLHQITKSKRPDYSVYARMNEGSETIIFGDKFSDWKEAFGTLNTKPIEASNKNIVSEYNIIFHINTR